MRISDVELDFWADYYTEHDLKRYLKFSTFIRAPKMHIQRIFNSEHRPLLADQENVRREIAKLGRYDLIERLERSGNLPSQAGGAA